ncbi:MAG TPA: isopeptide-forming domain-containing fimbrial protein, partial [Anaerolineales bacterium]|nr:isopeptide-forming domain-containing fimbrial protein [Anaerolineales bacterium]
MATHRSPRIRAWSIGIRIATMVFVVLSAFGPARVTPAFADKLICGVPGKDGPASSISGIVNTYYPGTANVSAGSTSLPVGSPSGAATPIQAGDLLLVIQMQGADINSTNTDAYGNGAAGGPASGNLASNFSAGLYEYVVASGPVAGGSVSISSGLANAYFDEDYPVGAASQGQRRYQVIRIPQYSSATLGGTVTALAWNGSVGGVVALDVAGTLGLNGNAIDVSGLGFRGGGGIRYGGGPGSATDYVTLSTTTANASKGEGTAGTPRRTYDGSAIIDLGAGQEGYPNGSFARGAPGNAGGGGTDGNPADNDENTGGGGGGNGGTGGDGGFAWDSVLDSGGFGGAAFSASPARLVMGGGGGAGTIDDNEGILSSGAPGGGIVMVRAGTVSGSGLIDASGSAAPGQTLNDSGGGGGAGGSVLVLAANGALPAGLNVTAAGGEGGDAWPGQAPGITYPGTRHGPGGGGGGGVIYLSSTAGTLSVAGGQNGITTTANDNYGSEPGDPGITATATPTNVTTGISGAECIPTPSVVKTTSTPLVTQTVSGTTGEYTIVVSIPANQGTALGFSISDTLPAGFTYASTTSVVTTGGADRVSTLNPTAGTSTPSWGTFNIPGGGEVEITFTVNIDASVQPGVYQNPATATYSDPTRTVSNGTTSTSYDSASSTGEDIEVIAASMPDLTVTKTNNVSGTVAQNSPFNWTITVANAGAGPAVFASGQTILSDALPGLAGFYPQGAVTVTPGATAPVGTIDCAISGTTLTCDASGIVTLATGASFNLTFQVTPLAAGTLSNTAIVDPDGIMPEGNENNNTSTDAVSVLGADLSIEKTDGQTSYLAGSTVVYTVTVTNLSGVTANGATVSDSRPANVSTWAWDCTSQTNGASGCDGAGSSASGFTDTVNLPVGGTIVYTVTATVVASPTGDLVNTATVAVPSGFSDPNPNNNSSTDTDTLTTTSADLSIVKTDGQTGYAAGGTVTYTVTLSNLSGVDITGALVSDPKPANIDTWAWACTGSSGGATGCTGAASSSAAFTDTVNLPVGGSIVYTVTANVVASPTGDLVNTATIAPPTGFADSDPSNNSSTDIDVLAVADLSITKDDGQVTYSGGDVLTYTVTVTNLSGVTATGAIVSDPRPANIDTWAWACTSSGGGATGCDPAANSASDFSDTVNLPAGGTIVYTVTANVVASPNGNLVNTATVTPPNGVSDPDPTNNSDTDTDIFGQASDLSLTKAANSSSVSVGSTITFTLTVTNTGPDAASGVQVTDQLPSGYTYVSSVASQGTYNSATGLWLIGDMPVNTTETLTLTVTVNSSGSYTNRAEVTASLLIDPDSTPGNDDPDEDDLDVVTVNIRGGDGNPPSPRTGFLIPVTGFKPNVVTDLSSVAPETYRATGDIMLEIPGLGVKIPVVGVPKKNGSWNVSWLGDQAGWLEGSAFPSWKGNSVLTSHVYLANGLPGPFVNLNKLTYGD